MTTDEALAVVHRNDHRELHVVGAGISRVLAAEVERLRAELIDTYLEAFYEIAHDEGDGWYSTNARQTCVWHGDRLVELGVFEEDQSRGVGRVRYYRPKAAREGTVD
jgi:hypothetical protein